MGGPSFRLDESDRATERKRLLNMIDRLVNWDNCNDKALNEKARKVIWRTCDGHPKPFLAYFADGGLIPLEAQRLGFEGHASDLSPCTFVSTMALTEVPPKWAGKPPSSRGRRERLGDWPGVAGLA
ncbi:hypothetical protein [Actinomadura pelletieri]|uniref:hypothetical protein n=1 Tax=Actinomadura pelletieri TaxID=111805 RepID=UPI0026B2DF44